jgi:acetyl-CoA acyltransferase
MFPHSHPPKENSQMSNRTFVIGVGMTKFDKPGTKDGDYPDWAKEAGTKALQDAGVGYDDIEQSYVGYCYGESTSGQRAVYGLGLTGIPVVNVNNNCSTGSTALHMARQAVRGGIADCALALGFEKMEMGSLGVKYTDRTNPMDKHMTRMFEMRDPEESPFAPQMFGNAGRDHMQKYGSELDHYAWIGWKNHKHSVNNPYAQFQDEYSLDDIKAAKMIHDPLTKLQCSPTSDGSACAIVASERFVDEHGLGDRAIEIAGQAMVTDMTSSFDENADCMTIVGYDMSKQAAHRAYEEAGVTADDVDVVELHDCFSANELITYEALADATGLGLFANDLWPVIKWGFVLAVLLAIITGLYSLNPVRKRAFPMPTFGGLVACALLVATTIGFDLYVHTLAGYDETYGALGGVISFLVWAWLSNAILLYGLALDQERKMRREPAG